MAIKQIKQKAMEIKMKLERRIAALETRVFPVKETITAIFRTIVNPGEGGKPPAGWRFDGGEVRRLPGESDKSLAQRAIQVARKKLEPGCFIPRLIEVN